MYVINQENACKDTYKWPREERALRVIVQFFNSMSIFYVEVTRKRRDFWLSVLLMNKDTHLFLQN